LHLKKWKSAEKLCNDAIKISPNCVPALITSGQIQLMLNRTRSAEDLFDRSLQINPRANVQKELGWLALQNKLFPKAISMLNDYLQRNSTDFEAYNLLLECFYKNERYKSGEECCSEIMKFAKDYDCFVTNYFLFKYLNNKISKDELIDLLDEKDKNSFYKFNLEILTEPIKSFDQFDSNSLKKKLLFQDFRFANTYSNANRLLIRDPKGVVRSFTKEIISIGRNPENDLVVDDTSVSRRHLVIINWKNDVWLQDLGSSYGTRLDKRKILDRVFVNGVYDLDIGRLNFRLYTNDNLLI